MEVIKLFNTEAEEAVLGGLLIRPDKLVEVIEIIKPDYFYSQKHKKIFQIILELTNENTPIDVITVSEELQNKALLETVGGRAYINDLAFNVISTANIAYYAESIANFYKLRELHKVADNIKDCIYKDKDSGKVLSEVQNQLLNLNKNQSGSGKPDIVADIAIETYGIIEKKYNNKGELLGLDTGFYDLNDYTGGLQQSDLIILAARPSMGKTAFCLNIAETVAFRDKKTVAFFSLEMSKTQLVQRLLASQAEISSLKLRDGNLSEAELSKLCNQIGKVVGVPLYIDDKPNMTVYEIRSRCKDLKMSVGLDLIIIDYLQLISGNGKNRVEEVSDISRRLKVLARELNVPIICLSQLSRALESRTIKKPVLSDLRESGSIEQDADIVMFIYREEYYERDKSEAKGKANIIIAKHRNGPVGEIELLFEQVITRFKNKIKQHI